MVQEKNENQIDWKINQSIKQIKFQSGHIKYHQINNITDKHWSILENIRVFLCQILSAIYHDGISNKNDVKYHNPVNIPIWLAVVSGSVK